MHADDLDLSYTALCQAMGRVGEAQAPLLLALVALSLMARQPSADAVLAAVQLAEQQCTPPPPVS